jgi:hypothetical protein
MINIPVIVKCIREYSYVWKSKKARCLFQLRISMS